MPASVLFATQFFASVGRLPPVDQARVNDFVLRFQANPAHPGLSLERVVSARSGDVWAARVSADLRAILYKDGATWALVYVDRHDPAYDWAARREIGRHTVTGALQIVEAVETVREVERRVEVAGAAAPRPALFAHHGDAYLLSLGVPESWLPAVREVRSEDDLCAFCGRLPDDVVERLLTLAAGEFVVPPTPVPPGRPAAEAEDTRRRFLVVDDAADLRAALAAPLERWIAFLHPSQRNLVTRRFSGPAKVSGSAGTGKTVVAMHRARHLARQGERVLLTTFVNTLCANLRRNLGMLCTEAELRAITVSTVHHQAVEIVRRVEPQVEVAPPEVVNGLLETFRSRHAPGYDAAFVRAEWEHVVRMQGIETWEGYRDAVRVGRGRALSAREREVLWRVFGGTLEALGARGLRDWPGFCVRAEALVAGGRVPSPYTAVVVDEVQDLRPPDLGFVRALCARHPGNLLLCGDTGQRIYPGGFTLGALGIDVRGRSAVLRINYRTTEQIRRAADRLLGPACDDMDGGEESRAGTRSLVHGPVPELCGHASREAELAAAVARVRDWMAAGIEPEAIGVFARTGAGVNAAGTALAAAGIAWRRLSDQDDGRAGGVRVGTMHGAKGLEFKAVLVLDCADGVVPHPAAMRGDGDPADREAGEARERRLLYVALTRARDELVVSWSGRPSRFLAPLLAAGDRGGTAPAA